MSLKSRFLYSQQTNGFAPISAALQDMMHKWWFTVSDGCNCNRHTLDAIKQMENWTVTSSILDFDGPPILDHMALGIAIKKSNEEMKAGKQT